jgi:lysozyme family protein
MKENFDIAMRFVFYYEKWKTVDPQDPGGVTVWGVCHRDFPAEVDQMLKMTPEAAQEFAKEIYRKRFWQEIGGDDIPSPLDIVIFDAAVNQGIQGIGRALDILNDCANWWDAIILRDDRYDDLLKFDRYGRGWSKRTKSLRDYITSGYTVLEWDRK